MRSYWIKIIFSCRMFLFSGIAATAIASDVRGESVGVSGAGGGGGGLPDMPGQQAGDTHARPLARARGLCSHCPAPGRRGPRAGSALPATSQRNDFRGGGALAARDARRDSAPRALRREAILSESSAFIQVGRKRAALLGEVNFRTGRGAGAQTIGCVHIPLFSIYIQRSGAVGACEAHNLEAKLTFAIKFSFSIIFFFAQQCAGNSDPSHRDGPPARLTERRFFP
jgi:hypothetical protein